MKYQFEYRPIKTADVWTIYGATFDSLNSAYKYLEQHLNKDNFEWQLMEYETTTVRQKA